MSVLRAAQEAAREIGLPEVTSLVGNSATTPVRLQSYINDIGQDLRSEHFWTELVKEHTFSLVASQESYPLPGDYDRTIPGTFWDRSGFLVLKNAQAPQEWQRIKGSLVDNFGLNRNFRIKGWSINQFFITPAPAAGEVGTIFAYEYISTNWLRPRSWEASLTFAANSYCSYNQNIYKTIVGGVTGASAPVHITGSASDGGVSWIFSDESYDRITADTDESILDERLLKLGCKWKYLAAKEFPGSRLALSEYENAKKKRIASSGPSPVLNIASGGIGESQLFGPGSIVIASS